MEPDLKKPPLAPKPRPQDLQPSVAVPKVPLLLPSAPKGLKPPIAPKPNLCNEMPEAKLTTRKGIVSRYSNGSVLVTNQFLALGVEDATSETLGQTGSSAAYVEMDFSPAADDSDTLETETALCHENGSLMPDGYEDQTVTQDAGAVISEDGDLSNVDTCGPGSAMPRENLQTFKGQAIAGGATCDEPDDGPSLKYGLLNEGSREATDNTESNAGFSQDLTEAADCCGTGAGNEWHSPLAAVFVPTTGEPNGQGDRADRQEEGASSPSDMLEKGADGLVEETDRLEERTDSFPGGLEKGANGQMEEADGQEEGPDSPSGMLEKGIDELEEVDGLEEAADKSQDETDVLVHEMLSPSASTPEAPDSLGAAESPADNLEGGADDLEEGSDSLEGGGESVEPPGTVSGEVRCSIDDKVMVSAVGEEDTVSAVGDEDTVSAVGEEDVVSAVGEEDAVSAVGEEDAVSAVGEEDAVSAVGEDTVSAVGEEDAVSAVGEEGTASAVGEEHTASAVGEEDTASAVGEEDAASAVGEDAVSAGGEEDTASAVGEEDAVSAVGEDTVSAVSEEDTVSAVGEEDTASAVGEEDTASAVGEEDAVSAVGEEDAVSAVGEDTVSAVGEDTVSAVGEEDAVSAVGEEDAVSAVGEEDAVSAVGEEDAVSAVGEEDAVFAVGEEDAVSAVGEDTASAVGEEDAVSAVGEDTVSAVGEEDAVSAVGEEDAVSAVGEEDAVSAVGEDTVSAVGEDTVSAVGEEDAASAVGEDAASAVGEEDAASAVGEEDAASAVGEEDAASAVGEEDAASAVGEEDAASAVGEEDAASAVGEEDTVSAVGDDTVSAVAPEAEVELVGSRPGVKGRTSGTEGEEKGAERSVHTGFSPGRVTAEDVSAIAHCVIGFPSRVKGRPKLRLETQADTSLAGELSLVGDMAGKAEFDKAVTAEWKKARARTQSLSAQVPETVPEETDPPPVEGHSPVKRQEAFESTMFAASQKYYMFYPRSYSVTGRELPVCADKEMEGSLIEDSRMNRKEDNLSLPSVAASNQRHVPSPGASPPSSMLDIPAPFQLASITKKPITKSSPSLLVEAESPDKYFKQSTKKKSSFKRFLPIKLSLKKKIENRITVEVNVCKAASEAVRALDFDRRSLGNSPQLKSRSGKMRKSDSSSTFLFYKDGKGKGIPRPFNRSVSRVESFEDRSRHSYTSLPLTKPRSISFPNTDSSDYENIPAVSSDYENIQIPPDRIGHSGTVTEFFEDPSRNFSSACENDGYVDMSSFTPLDSRQRTEQELESADSEILAMHQSREEMVSSEQTGNSSESEELTTQSNMETEAYRIAKMMTTSERAFVNLLEDLHSNFREVVTRIVGGNAQPVVDQKGVTHTLHYVNELHTLHQGILKELEQSTLEWNQTGPTLGHAMSVCGPRLSMYFRYIEQFDSSVTFLEEYCWKAPRISTAPHQSEVPGSDCARVKQQLFGTLRHVSLYHHQLTDYLKHLSPDTTEYEDTKAVLAVVAEVCDQVRLRVKHGENLQKLLAVEHRVKGFHQAFQPGRMLIKEGRLLRLTDGAMQPRYCFLLSDVFLYTVPKCGGKCQLRKVLPLEALKVRKLCADMVENVLRIQGVHGSLTLCASSAQDCDDWESALSTAVEDLPIVRPMLAQSEELEVSSVLGTTPPMFIPASHVVMCMLCTADFTLPWRRLHCNTCGKVVCRTCCRNKYPLGYMKGRLARVCDQCHKELKRTGPQKEEILQPSLAHSPTKRFSSMFNILHTPHACKQRTKQVARLETASSHEGVTMSGDLQRRKASKRQWKKLWFVIHDKVLYTYKSREDEVAAETLPLLGFTVKQWKDGEPTGSSAQFRLYHKNSLYYSFKAEDTHTAQRIQAQVQWCELEVRVSRDQHGLVNHDLNLEQMDYMPSVTWWIEAMLGASVL